MWSTAERAWLDVYSMPDCRYRNPAAQGTGAIPPRLSNSELPELLPSHVGMFCMKSFRATMRKADGRGRCQSLDTGQEAAVRGSPMVPIYDKSFQGPIWLQASAMASLRVRAKL